MAHSDGQNSFQKSNLTLRSPDGRHDESHLNCKLCDQIDSDEMVACDQCDSWFHYTCVGVTHSIADMEWSCQNCNEKRASSKHKNQPKANSTQLNTVPISENAAKRTNNLGSTSTNKALTHGVTTNIVESQNKPTSNKSSQSHHTLSSTTKSNKTSESKEAERSLALLEQEKELALTRLQDNTNGAKKLAETELKLKRLEGQLEEKRLEVKLTRDLLLQEASAKKKLDEEYLVKKAALIDKISSHGSASSMSSCKSRGLTTKWVTSHHGSRLDSDLIGSGMLKATQPLKVVKENPTCRNQQKQRVQEDSQIQQSSTSRLNPVGWLSARNQTQFLDRSNYNNETGTSVEMLPKKLTKDQINARQTMPKHLPKFDGNPRDWAHFYSTYLTTTRICGFSNSKAREKAYPGLMLPETVPKAINALRLSFGRPEIIVESLMEEIHKFTPIKDECHDQVVDLSLKVQYLCAIMEAAQLDAHLDNPILRQDIINKLPSTMRLSWSFHKRTIDKPNLSALNEWLFDIAEAVGDVSQFNRFDRDSKNLLRDGKNTRAFFATSVDETETEDTNVLATHTERTTTKSTNLGAPAVDPKSIKCGLCSEGHVLKHCPKFLNSNKQERWSLVFKHHVCSSCLGSHDYRRCKAKQPCGVNGCQKNHHVLLHKNKNTQANTSAKDSGIIRKGSEAESNSTPNDLNAHVSTKPNITFRVIPVTVQGPRKSTNIFAFFDEGSSVTLLEDELASELELNGPIDPLCLRWTGNTTKEESRSRRVSLKISGTHSNATVFNISDVRTISNLNLPVQGVSPDDLQKRFEHLRSLPIQEYENAVPRLLIGLQHSSLGVPLEVREGKWGEPVAVKTRLGWTVFGMCAIKESDNFVQFHACNCRNDDDLHKQVREFFSLENFGVKNTEVLLESREDRRSRELLEGMTKRVAGRFETGLLWRYDDVKFPNSLPMANRRFSCLERKMSREPTLKQNLREQMRGYVSKGYARKLTGTAVIQSSPRTWYLPVFSVTNPNKPGKVRMVWDAAAAVEGVSLNSMLLSGPDLLTPLPDVLVRFREGRFAVSGDIREMFHQILINNRDRESQRFLWRDSDDSPIEIYEMRVMTFGATCSPSAAQFVKNLNAHEHSVKFPEAYNAIVNCHYVDDYLQSFKSEEEAIKVVNQVRQVHKMGGFHMHNWLTNSEIVQAALGAQESDNSKNLNVGNLIADAKILGMWWSTIKDKLHYTINTIRYDKTILDGSRSPTKREVLRTLMTIFDPLGLIAYILVFAKILLHDIWRASIGWDESVTDEQFERWLRWTRTLAKIENLEIPRCYSLKLSSKKTLSTELHIFVDASEGAYAAAAYLRVEDEVGVECTLIMAKTKVAPQKPISIPRMELLAAVLGVRLSKNIQRSHTIQFSSRRFWSDSIDVLSWLRSDARKYRQFVAFRISEILEATDEKEWRWVPTKQNVADEATKWKEEPNVSSNNRWFRGPQFLWQPPDEWPVEKQNSKLFCEEEMRPNLIHHEIFNGNLCPDATRFMRWRQLLRSQTFVLRFFCRAKRLKPCSTGELTVAEIVNAERELYRNVQQSQYHSEIHSLKSSPPAVEKSSTLYTLSPFLDQYLVLRVRGRTNKAAWLSEDTKNPIILAPDHRITKLIINSYHHKFHHQNNETVVNEIRQKFWIPKLRAALKKVIRDCQRCKNDRAKPSPPMMSDLPLSRMATYTKPFTFVGVDYFGPQEVAVGRRVEKRWGVIFTCLTIRGIHIEIAHSLNTDSCIMCIRNFIARRGVPKELFSDNGTNFVGANNELQKELKNVEFDQLVRCFDSIIWNFNPPLSPHMGGCWERLIRSIKATLDVIQLSRRPSDELYRSYLMEAENTINSRPLTYIPLEKDTDESLTPNHFILGTSSGSKPAGCFSDDVLILRKSWKISQYVANQFWRRWIREYLPDITRRTKWFYRAKPIRMGDVVVIWDDNRRGSWQKGIIIDVIKGNDDQIRQVVVRTDSGLYTRPVVKIAVLDVYRDNEDGKDIDNLTGISPAQATGGEDVAAMANSTAG